MYELSVAMSAVVFPLPLVAGAIRPHLYAITVTETPNPLPLVGRTRLESVQWSLLSLGFRVVLLLRHSLPGFFNCEIFAVGLF
jgi:hypothetical protein